MRKCMLSSNIQQQSEHPISKSDEILQNAADGTGGFDFSTTHVVYWDSLDSFLLQLSLGLNLLHRHNVTTFKCKMQPVHY